MGLDDPDDDIPALFQPGARLEQHLVGLADTGGRAEKNLEPAGAAFLLARLGKQGVGRWTLIGLAPLFGHAAPILKPIPCPLATGYVPALSRARLSSSTLTRASPRSPRVRPLTRSSTSLRTSISDTLRAFAIRGTWK